jgi:hypothetical protein
LTLQALQRKPYFLGDEMILKIDRGHIEVEIGDRIAIVQGEMFFPGNEKMGFVLYLDTIDFWEPKIDQQAISKEDADAIISDIQADFAKGGHTLEIETPERRKPH